MAKNKSPHFHNLSQRSGARENRLFCFEENEGEMRKEERISLLTLQRKHPRHTLRCVKRVTGEREHVIKTFTHEVKISLICFQFFFFSLWRLKGDAREHLP